MRSTYRHIYFDDQMVTTYVADDLIGGLEEEDLSVRTEEVPHAEGTFHETGAKRRKIENPTPTEIGGPPPATRDEGGPPAEVQEIGHREKRRRTSISNQSEPLLLSNPSKGDETGPSGKSSDSGSEKAATTEGNPIPSNKRPREDI